jgi:hypothetical protein
METDSPVVTKPISLIKKLSPNENNKTMIPELKISSTLPKGLSLLLPKSHHFTRQKTITAPMAHCKSSPTPISLLLSNMAKAKKFSKSALQVVEQDMISSKDKINLFIGKITV